MWLRWQNAPLCGPLGLTAGGRPVIFWAPNVFFPLTAKKWQVDREEGRRARLALEVGLRIESVHRWLGRPGTRRAQGNAGAQGLPALFALWPSLQERGRFASTEAQGGRTLLFPGHSCMVAMPGRTKDKFLLQVMYAGPQEARVKTAEAPRPIGWLVKLLLRSQDSDFALSSGVEGGVPCGPLCTDS